MNNIYRVCLSPNDSTVEVLSLGVNVLDPDIEGVYHNIDSLPDWVQERLAVLMLTRVPPPRDEVSGIGMRVDENTFWVEPPNAR